MKMMLERGRRGLVNPFTGWSDPLLLMLFTADMIIGFCSPGGSRRAVPSSEGLTSNSTPEAGSQWSWVTMKESVLAKKRSRETGRILLVRVSCCAPPSVALRWLKRKKGKISFPGITTAQSDCSPVLSLMFLQRLLSSVTMTNTEEKEQ